MATIKEDIDYLKAEIEKLKATNTTLGNILSTLVTHTNYLIQYQTGSWEIKNKQMIFYNLDGDVLETYDLFNANNIPTNTSVFKRVKK